MSNLMNVYEEIWQYPTQFLPLPVWDEVLYEWNPLMELDLSMNEEQELALVYEETTEFNISVVFQDNPSICLEEENDFFSPMEEELESLSMEDLQVFEPVK